MINKLTLFVTIILVTINLFGQTTEFVKCDSITYPIHKTNIGKIAFMSKIVPIETFTPADFLTTFEVKEKSDLNIRVLKELCIESSKYISEHHECSCRVK